MLASRERISTRPEALPSEASSVAVRQRQRARWEAMTLSALMLLVVGAGIFGLWRSSREAEFQGFRHHLIELAKAAASTIDPVLHERIRRPEQLNDADYNRAVAPLRRLRQALPTVHYVYTVVQVGGTIHFVLDAADPHARTPSGQPDQSGVWEVYPYRTEPMAQALGDGRTEGTAAASTELSSDAWGTFMTGLAPIRDLQGHQIGAVGLDVDASVVAARLAGFRNRALFGLVQIGRAHV